MTLGRLMELYQAEQQGKQIMMRTCYHGFYGTEKNTSEIKLTECELKDLILDNQEGKSYFIKNEEDEYVDKL